MSAFDTVIRLAFLAAATAFVLGLHEMNSPATARRGNRLSAAGMALAIGSTLALVIHTGDISGTGWAVLGTGTAIGAVAGLRMARTVQMTAMPQLVSLFNAVGGGAAALVAITDFIRVAGEDAPGQPVRIVVAVVLDVVIGSVTLSGSLIASGKLQGLLTSAPVVFPAARLLNLGLGLAVAGGAGYLFTGSQNVLVLLAITVAAAVFGVTMVLPIGGADMPVVISLLNAFTGTAVAMAGFVLDSPVLIIAGALVGASGGILTKLMADAMNRSITEIIIGGFGVADSTGVAVAGADAQVRAVTAEDAAIQLGYASKVIVVPGYGLAAAQAQYEMRELAELLEARGVDVSYAIHPVAGRMPGHMNVLLAEANVPYPQLKEMDDINPEFARADVALVVGANDVTNPAARRPGNPISGMPILDVDQARSVIVIKRSMGQGYAGLDNDLYADPKTGMFFADAKRGLAAITAAVKAEVPVG
ncbi:MAG TPA: NAD(P)(+) transhydrogenase (Re/Si-specific) subunit beta [Mycobacteriales bacterium]|nr:NAD(P)(+) transhydrogenase (Re/Si-specific) subunit beta [Mycobacteriales bacterium]